MATSDVQAVTKDISTIISGVAGRRSAASSESAADEDSLLKHLIAAINTKRKSEEGISTTELKKMSEALKYRTAQERLRLDYAKIDSSDRQAVYAGQVTLQKGREANITKYFKAVRSPDMEMVQVAEREFAGGDGRDSFLAAWKVWTQPQTYLKADKPKIAQDDPAYTATFKQIMNNVNQFGEIVVFDENGLVDISKTRAILKRRQIQESTLTNFEAEVEAYNVLMARRNEQSSMLARQKEEGRERLKAAQGHLERKDNAAFDNTIEGAKEAAHMAELAAEAMGGIIDKDEAIAAIESANLRRESSAEADWVIKYIREQLGGSDQDKIRDGLAKGIGNEGFRAWAADHGFDRLGRVQTGKDGKLVLSSYVEGGDDVAALLAWKKQSLRRAGNYGLRGIDSGEIWSVELRDGTLVTGRRLKRHAADPMGAIRIVTADGARVITPQEAKQASILQRPEPSVSRIDRRAKRLYNQDVERGTYARLEDKALWSSGLQDEATLYQDDAGNYYKDTETGEYIRQDVMEARRIRAGKGSPFQFTDDGTPYVIDPESASVYKVTGAGLEKVDEEVANAVIAKVPQSGERSLLVTGEGDDQRLVSSGDLEAAVGSAEKADLIGVPDTPEEKARVDSLVAASMTAEGLGYKSTDEPPPETIRGDGKGVAGIWMVEPGPGDQVTVSDEDALAWDNALEEVQMGQTLGLTDDDPPADTSGSRGIEGTGPKSMSGTIVRRLSDPSLALEDKKALANKWQSSHPVQYGRAYEGLKDRTDLGFELPPPQPIPAAETPAAAPAEATPVVAAAPAPTDITGQEGFTWNEETNEWVRDGYEPSKKTSKPKTPAAADRSALVGAKTPKSLQDQETVPMSQGDTLTDVGQMKLDARVLAPPTTVPEEDESDASLTEGVAEDVDAPNLSPVLAKIAGLLKKKKKKKTTTDDDVDDSAEASTPAVLGASGNVGGTEITEDDDEVGGAIGKGKDMSSVAEMNKNLRK
tara:strand:- start:10279 stop:13230 length:2952 start_codon:yes stop_codon:yes gene_type:complete